ncbi:hypothetical protein HELRODRAFT_122772, partial [Helobdella robusta]|uniref:FCP1 homology domain-containing protein n=1 Tax=Helobdella robusta TaxID=6412 RepID=T1EGV8_HELRO
RVCLVVDLDETLVHSTFKVITNPDYIIPVEIDSRVYSVYVLKRPYAELFIDEIGGLFECILFTASLSKYADPLTNLLDRNKVFQHRLFREACIFKKGIYIKDLQSLGRPLDRLALLDNSPTSYMNQPNNGIPIKSWFGDMKDRELLKLIPHLKKLATCTNVYTCL